MYVPLTGSVFVSTNFAVLAADTVKTCDPFGFRSEIFMDAMFEPVMLRETRWPAVPLNVAVAELPEFEIVTVTGAPPGTIVKVEAPALDPSTAVKSTAKKAAHASRVEVRRPTTFSR